jgi:crossover junction endodeoxyribonuclease RusA
MKVVLNLPYPPSVNSYWQRNQNGSVRVSDKAKAFRAQVVDVTKPLQLQGRLSVSVDLTMPDKRGRDIDNPMKALLDALQYARVIENDEQIDELNIRRIGIKKGGSAYVEIEQIEE